MPSSTDSPQRFVHRLLRARDWQDRPQFREVCEWWSDGGSGVLALVGIGGSGKTAIAERFLQVVPGGYPEHPKVSKDTDLPALSRVFVFSFYDAPNPDSFVAELGNWLRGPDADGEEQETTLSYHQLLQLLPSAGPCLLVLDGLEKVQDDGSRGGAFGQINDGRLRDFILRVSDALLPDVTLLITSRFRLYDPLAHRTDCYRQVDVEQLEPDAAVKLLQDRGVEKGTRRQLEDVAREQGFHALSVDLTGGYIARFCRGDATQLPAFESLDLSDLDPRLNPADRALAEQERRFVRLAERYEEALTESDPAALALLQRVCLFRLGIDVDTVAAIFTGQGKSEISGPALSKLKKPGVRSKLKLLASMGLVEASATRADEPEERTIYTIHPAVRDGFRNSLDRETALASHDAAREGLKASLGEQPGRNPSDTQTLDLLEEIIYHAISSGHTDEAWEMYDSHIGGFQNLGWRLGQFDRGERICRAFENADVSGNLNKNRWLRNSGYFLTHLGDVTRAAAVFRQVEPKDVFLANAAPDLAKVRITQGRLTDVNDVVETSSTDTYEENRAAYPGCVSALQGRVETALDFFGAANWGDDEFLYADYGIWQFETLARLNRAAITRRHAELHRDKCLLWHGDIFIPKLRLLLAELSLRCGDAENAADELQQASDWALERDAREVLCWSAMFRGRLELAQFGEDGRVASDSLQQAAVATEEGLRIARDCGYAVFHVDLLLQQARVNLLHGLPESALADVSLAVEDGLSADEVTGRPDIPAASDKRFGYAWGIVEGLHLRGEAQLLQAAQRLGSATYTPRSRKTPSEVRELIAEGKRNLEKAMRRWKTLRDPEPPEDNNFVHPETGEEYNYRAAETYDVLKALSQGVLTTRYPLQPLTADPHNDPTTTTTMKKTILELDLIGYSDIARELEEQLGAALVMQFNDQIKEHVRAGLKAANLSEDEVVVQSTGDGAIVVLDEAEHAHLFAEEVSKICQEQNKGKTSDSAKRYFRIAAATGDVEIRGADLAGTVIANAVRLETAGSAGHFIVDIPTWERLPERLQKNYLPEEMVRGKRDEMIPARRILFDDAPRPDHVTLTLDIKRADFTDLSAGAFTRELRKTLGSDGLSIVRITEGSTSVTIDFEDSKALARFIDGHASGNEDLATFLANWKVKGITYSAELKHTTKPNPQPLDAGTGPSKKELGDALAELSREEIGLLGAKLEIGVADSASKPAAITTILNWATTDRRKNDIASEIEKTVGPSEA